MDSEDGQSQGVNEGNCWRVREGYSVEGERGCQGQAGGVEARPGRQSGEPRGSSKEVGTHTGFGSFLDVRESW